MAIDLNTTRVSNGASYLERQLLVEQDSLAIAKRAQDGILYSLWRELGYWINDPKNHLSSPKTIERLIDWATDGQGRIDLIEATIDEIKGELS